jgi:hypothetical protein
MSGKPSDESYDDAEITRRSEAALLRALSTPHKKQSEMKVGGPRHQPKREPESSRRGSDEKTNDHR